MAGMSIWNVGIFRGEKVVGEFSVGGDWLTNVAARSAVILELMLWADTLKLQ